MAQALRDTGVDAGAISVIPDEQQAVDAALRMGQPGDLVLVFADALARTWKQITRFVPDGAAPVATPHFEAPLQEPEPDDVPYVPMQGVVREERGLVFEREEND